MPRRHAFLTAIAAAVLLTVAACGTAAAPPPPPNTLTTPKPGATPSATPDTAFPREATSPDPNFDTGFTVLITPAGFHPQWLVAPCCATVTWRNMTNAPVTVVFDHVVGGSGQPIAPGGTYAFVPQNIESITYHSGQNSAMTGRIQVNQLPE